MTKPRLTCRGVFIFCLPEPSLCRFTQCDFLSERRKAAGRPPRQRPARKRDQASFSDSIPRLLKWIRLSLPKGAKGRVPACRRQRISSPVTLTATPVSSAAEQQQNYDDNHEQLDRHGTSMTDLALRHRAISSGI